MITEREGLEENKIYFYKDLFIRLISSIVLIFFALYLNYKGEFYFLAAIIIASIILIIEFYRLFDNDIFNINFFIVTTSGIMAIFFIHFGAYFYFFSILLAGFILSLYLKKNKNFIQLIPYFYIYLPLGALTYLNNSINGKTIIFWLFIVVWTTDISGYFFGKLLKGPKLCPQISPNKTWSGFISGVFLSGISSIIYAHWLEYDKFTMFFLYGLLGAIVCTAGDLFESKLKRINMKKDSSGIIPGHGGLLDRLDGFLFAILYFYLLSIIKEFI